MFCLYCREYVSLNEPCKQGKNIHNIRDVMECEDYTYNGGVNEKQLLELQKDLRNGLTLEEALQKHGLTFKEAVTQMPRPLTDKAWSKRK